MENPNLKMTELAIKWWFSIARCWFTRGYIQLNGWCSHLSSQVGSGPACSPCRLQWIRGLFGAQWQWTPQNLHPEKRGNAPMPQGEDPSFSRRSRETRWLGPLGLELSQVFFRFHDIPWSKGLDSDEASHLWVRFYDFKMISYHIISMCFSLLIFFGAAP